MWREPLHFVLVRNSFSGPGLHFKTSGRRERSTYTGAGRNDVYRQAHTQSQEHSFLSHLHPLTKWSHSASYRGGREEKGGIKGRQGEEGRWKRGQKPALTDFLSHKMNIERDICCHAFRIRKCSHPCFATKFYSKFENWPEMLVLLCNNVHSDFRMHPPGLQCFGSSWLLCMCAHVGSFWLGCKCVRLCVGKSRMERVGSKRKHHSVPQSVTH